MRKPNRRKAESDLVTNAAAADPDIRVPIVEIKASENNFERFFRSGYAFSSIILAVAALTYGLYVGREVALPLALAVVLKLLFQPSVQVLCNHLRLPQIVGAIVVIVGLTGILAGLAIGVSGPVSGWVEKVPQVIPAVEQKLAVLRTPIESLQNVFKEIEDVATPAAGGDASTIAVKQPSSIGRYLAVRTTTVFGYLVTMLVMLFFLLASGDRLLRAFIEILPKFSDKRQAVEIANQIQQQIGAYLLTITIMNSLVGAATGLATWASGLGDPLLWALVAFLLNFVPVLGPLVGVGVLAVVGVVALDWPWHALQPALLYLLIHIAEGEVITPMLLAKRFTLNPVLVILSLFFWFSIWGVAGAILAIPFLAMFKITCDRVEPLRQIGHLLGA